MSLNLRGFVESFYSNDFWHAIAKKKSGVGFGFLALFTLVGTIIIAISALVLGKPEFETLLDQAAKELPRFEINNYELSMNEPSPYVISGDGRNFVFDMNGNFAQLPLAELQRNMEKEHIALLVDKNNVILFKEQTGEIRVMGFKELELKGPYIIDAEFIKGLSEYYWIIVLVSAVVLYPFFFTYRIVQALLYSLVAMLVNQIIKAKLEYDSILRICSFAIYPAALLAGVAWFLGSDVPLFVCLLITTFYVAFALKSAK